VLLDFPDAMVLACPVGPPLDEAPPTDGVGLPPSVRVPLPWVPALPGGDPPPPPIEELTRRIA
jgi:hypothetical protein